MTLTASPATFDLDAKYRVTDGGVLAIRGYEQIKLSAVARYESERERLRPLLRRPSGQDFPG